MTENTQKKGTILQAVKAIAVLVVICLVCGALLALCNDLFYISDAERERRAEAKINKSLTAVYPAFVEDTSFNSKKIDKEHATNSAFGSISKVVKSTDGTFILAADGIGGYGGSITVLVAIDKDAKIVAWKISDRGGETYAADVEQHTDWYIGETISTDITLLKHSGASLTSTALNNAIKMASYYAMNVLNLGSNPEGDARKALGDLLAGTDYADYEFTTSLDTAYRAASAVGDNVLSFYFTGVKEGFGNIAAYAFNVETKPQIVVVKDDVTHAERLLASSVIAKSEGVADELVASVQSRSYLEYTVQKIYADFTYAGGELNSSYATNASYGQVNSAYMSGDGAIVLETVGIGGYSNGNVTLNVVIKDGVIKAWSIVDNEKQSFISNVTSKWDAADDPVKNWFINSSIDSVQATVEPDTGAGKGTGATYTENAIANAINMACYYVKNTTVQGGGN